MGQVVSLLPNLDPHGQDTASQPLALGACQGRLVELSGQARSASLSFAMQWVLAAQQQGELAAWVQTNVSRFYPPDAAEAGVDLSTFPIVTLATSQALARAAEHLLRSGAFSLVVLDLATGGDLPIAAQSRLLGLAQKHHTALVCLTDKSPETASLGSLVSLRVHTEKRQLQGDRFSVASSVIKDKRRGPGAQQMQVFYGPAGMR